MNELYINNELVDLPEDVGFSFNYAIANIKDPTKRKGTFTKTITIPGTKNNNRIFSSIYDISKVVSSQDESVNYTPDFNPNLKAPAIFFTKSLNVFTGIARLLSVTVVNRHVSSYEITLRGNTVDLFDSMKDDKLTDLDFLEYIHELNYTNIKDSWDTKIQKNGGDYVNFSGPATDYFANGSPTGEGYVYPTIDYGWEQNPDIFPLKRYSPAIYVREYINKIFNKYGFTYQSRFFDSAEFRRLIIPYKSDGVIFSESLKESFFTSVSKDATQNIPGFIYREQVGMGGVSTVFGQTVTSVPLIDFDDLTGDPNGNYVSNEYVVAQTGPYNFLLSGITADLTMGLAEPDSAVLLYRFNVRLQNETTGQTLGTIVGDLGSTVQKTDYVFDDMYLPGVQLEKGDRISVRIYCRLRLRYTYPASNSSSLDIAIKAGTFEASIASITLTEGGINDVNAYVPKDIKIRDFFRSIITGFNLFIDVDPSNPANLLIEPVRTFYSIEGFFDSQISNGDFLTNLDSWTNEGTAGVSWYWDSGRACANVQTGGSNFVTKRLTQLVDLKENFSYSFSVDVITQDAQSYVVVVYLNGGLSNQETIYASGTVSGDNTYSFTFTSPYDASNIAILLVNQGASPTTLCIDNVIFNGVGSSTIEKDITKKVDRSSDIQILPVSEVEGKTYRWSYKEDKDYYNALYTTNEGEIYGEYERTINNDFVTGEKKFELIFSPTPSVGAIGSGLVVPRIFNRKDDGTVEPFKHNIRLLQYGGVHDGNHTVSSEVDPPVYETQFAYCGHLDHPFTPTSDLLFSVPKSLFWGSPSDIGTNYTNNNLFRRYYQNFIEELTSKDAKIIKCKALFTDYDVHKLDFKELLYFDNAFFRLYDLTGYRPGTKSLVDLTLLKVLVKDPFTYQTETINEVLNQPSNYDILEGGEDEVRDIAATGDILIVEGGEDEVRNAGATGDIFNIEGGIDG